MILREMNITELRENLDYLTDEFANSWLLQIGDS
jgi:hypothetical protein